MTGSIPSSAVSTTTAWTPSSVTGTSAGEPGRLKVVQMMVRQPGSARWRSAATVRPSRPGICTSSSAMSGEVRCAAANASVPVPTSATTSVEVDRRVRPAGEDPEPVAGSRSVNASRSSAHTVSVAAGSSARMPAARGAMRSSASSPSSDRAR